ncbi:hypothetical protein [Salinisphaera hydrothermalis]|uniref:Cytoplasmic protein n=1 Tax=Salinisphaera hydrothermalis (strain C41B8) TaxID=1304275 RepID=A0A084ILL8_SALHC|nr:hypothetical protein [Salinisphaera hydrothermalis]KEZ77602.1 hypothetical protein C41B8_09496 [Salinisphaera hydrothermalis C41B8]
MADTNMPEIKLDAENMYREESFSDLKVGSIRKLIPVTANGDDDDSREVRYEGSASLMTPAGSLPLSFDLEADDLAGAIDKFPEAVNAAAERAIDELKEMQRQQSQKIQVPGQGGGYGGGQGGFGGGQGGGRIQF